MTTKQKNIPFRHLWCVLLWRITFALLHKTVLWRSGFWSIEPSNSSKRPCSHTTASTLCSLFFAAVHVSFSAPPHGCFHRRARKHFSCLISLRSYAAVKYSLVKRTPVSQWAGPGAVENRDLEPADGPAAASMRVRGAWRRTVPGCALQRHPPVACAGGRAEWCARLWPLPRLTDRTATSRLRR
jgi:hypothetical protein